MRKSKIKNITVKEVFDKGNPHFAFHRISDYSSLLFFSFFFVPFVFFVVPLNSRKGDPT